MDTSSPVVGSSAMSSRGFVASAIAIITRWHMPPESWWAYCPARRSGSAMPASRSMATARSRARPGAAPPCRTSSRSICRPTGSTGFSDVRGLWNTMEI